MKHLGQAMVSSLRLHREKFQTYFDGVYYQVWRREALAATPYEQGQQGQHGHHDLVHFIGRHG